MVITLTQTHTHTHTHTHHMVPHLIALGERLDSLPVVLLPMVEQWTYFPSVFRSEDSRRRKT